MSLAEIRHQLTYRQVHWPKGHEPWDDIYPFDWDLVDIYLPELWALVEVAEAARAYRLGIKHARSYEINTRLARELDEALRKLEDEQA